MRNGSILHQIAAAKDDQPPYLAVNTEHSFAMKVFFLPLRTDPLPGFHRIFTSARHVQLFFVDVGGVDLYVVFRNPRPEMFRQQDCDRVRLFATGAARAPHPKRMAGLQRF